MQAAHGLHHSIDGAVIQHALEVLCHLRVGQGHVLKADHLCNLNILHFGGDIVDTSTHNAKAKQTDFHICSSEIYV